MSRRQPARQRRAGVDVEELLQVLLRVALRVLGAEREVAVLALGVEGVAVLLLRAEERLPLRVGGVDRRGGHRVSGDHGEAGVAERPLESRGGVRRAVVHAQYPHGEPLDGGMGRGVPAAGRPLVHRGRRRRPPALTVKGPARRIRIAVSAPTEVGPDDADARGSWPFCRRLFPRAGAAGAADAPTAPDYARDVAPDPREALRRVPRARRSRRASCASTAAAEVLAGGMSGAVIVPGRSRDSLLVRHLRGRGARRRCRTSGRRSTPSEIATHRGVDRRRRAGSGRGAGPSHEAATRPAHWAYVKPVRPARAGRVAPRVGRAARSTPSSSRASRRRASRPRPRPTARRSCAGSASTSSACRRRPAEIDAFLADTSPDAYEKLVDRLLASPHYGERWARPWLDLARYADTNGYEKDQAPRRLEVPRLGDRRARTATCRSATSRSSSSPATCCPGPTTSSGSPPASTATRSSTRRAASTSRRPASRRSSTASTRPPPSGSARRSACAQCHNHKFDPFSQKDYYRLMAFFDNGEYTRPRRRRGGAGQLDRRAGARAHDARAGRATRGAAPRGGDARAREAHAPARRGARGLRARDRRARARVRRRSQATARRGAERGTAREAAPTARSSRRATLEPTDTYTVTACACRGASRRSGSRRCRTRRCPKQGPGRAGSGGFVADAVSRHAPAAGRCGSPRALADGADPRRPAARILDAARPRPAGA